MSKDVTVGRFFTWELKFGKN